MLSFPRTETLPPSLSKAPASEAASAPGVEVSSLKPKVSNVDKDGDRDLTMKFGTAGADFECGNATALFTGATRDSVTFETVGIIDTVGCQQEGRRPRGKKRRIEAESVA